MNRLKLRESLHQFLIEDIGDRDVTSELIFPEDAIGEGHFVAKAEGTLAGCRIISEVYHLLDPDVKITTLKKDRESVYSGDLIASVYGNVRTLLTGERVILNLVQRLSGIATLTDLAVKTLNSDYTRICDTRKTTPGLRMYEKYAVTCGGGFNHRFGLDDGIMIKDNHIAFCGSITEAVQRVRKSLGHMVKIEVETENKEQLLEAVDVGVDVIMLDNCSPEKVKELVPLIPSSIISEVSGNITIDNISLYRDSGVQYISLGMLTHSVKALDISLDVKERGECK
ncbi:carboxylating nicotinate-nucleotide diphosphorylase [Aquibacillus salsiterrae]|uniref:Probable nicotinate-nucleotide pyrophosphorylase [carboxylating] n=1 Tax=Aquibacillus salsiterrae TaxID=2950439 RepID=A0A9X3WBU8_9BACI|nr:carboxylating nicotinate-nucleotide diphosphorylase [Aquibacillus salsiterrae]MDC3415653.1 carboxylating nicotinate-nucleotide diphosphorylase [Aquibacillus salsiterrae]